MPEFRAVASLAEFTLLDEGEILKGYFDGFHDAPEPGSDRSSSYWHGYRNGRFDNGSLPLDAAAKALRREMQQIQPPH